jgi:hypothetical protein
MTYGEKRILFTRLLAQLIAYINDYDNGQHVCAIDYVRRCDNCGVGNSRSLHKLSLAADIHLYRFSDTGKRIYLRKTEHHEPFGQYWVGLHPYARWGGMDGKDGNHYSIVHGPMIY